MAGPSISSITILTATVPVNGLFEVTCLLSGTYTNVFDFSEVALSGRFTDPSGHVYTPMPGFWDQQYTVTGHNSTHGETYATSGSPTWKVRFRPTIAGTWSFTLVATTAGGTTVSTVHSFSCTGAISPNAHLAPWKVVANRLFAYEDGTWFAPIGHNYAYEDRDDSLAGTLGADDFLARLATNGANTTRIKMHPHYGWDIEEFTAAAAIYSGWDNHYPGSAGGPYNLIAAWVMDYRLQKAMDEGLSVILALQTADAFSTETLDPQFADNPYKASNGGTVTDADPTTLYTDGTALQFMQRRLRYSVARWGAYASLGMVEFGDEMGSIGTSSKDSYLNSTVRGQMGIFVASLIDFWKTLDPWQHLWTWSQEWQPTLLGLAPGPRFDNVWLRSEIDVGQLHAYHDSEETKNGDPWTSWQALNDFERRILKPILMGERGLYRPGGVAPEANFDPTTSILTDPQISHLLEGTHFHNELWANLMSRARFGGHFYWGSYLRDDSVKHRTSGTRYGASWAFPLDSQYAAVAAFLAGEDLSTWGPITDITGVVYHEPTMVVFGMSDATHIWLWARDELNRYDSGALPGDMDTIHGQHFFTSVEPFDLGDPVNNWDVGDASFTSVEPFDLGGTDNATFGSVEPFDLGVRTPAAFRSVEPFNLGPRAFAMPRLTPSGAIVISGLTGSWDVEVWSPYTGTVLNTNTIDTNSGQLNIPVGGYDRDIAIKATQGGSGVTPLRAYKVSVEPFDFGARVHTGLLSVEQFAFGGSNRTSMFSVEPFKFGSPGFLSAEPFDLGQLAGRIYAPGASNLMSPRIGWKDPAPRPPAPPAGPPSGGGGTVPPPPPPPAPPSSPPVLPPTGGGSSGSPPIIGGPPPSGHLYGMAIAADSLNNIQVGGASGPNLTVFYRFRAQQTGTLKAFRVYLVDGSGYSGGTGGSFHVTLQTDDGTSDHFPSGTVLATSPTIVPGNPINIGYLPLISFATPPAVTADVLYHLVFANLDGSPTVNFVSVDCLWYAGAVVSPMQPRFADVDWGDGYRSGSGAWTADTENRTPILDLTYSVIGRPWPLPVTTATLVASVDNSGATDVTSALSAFIQAAPSGTILSFPYGTYKISGCLDLRGKNNLILEWNGSTINNTADANVGDSGLSSFFSTQAAGYGTYPGPISTHITIRNAIAHGASPSPGTFQVGEYGAFLRSWRGQYIEVDNVTADGLFGDLVTFNDIMTYGYVHDCHVIDCGRSNVSVVDASHVLIESNLFDKAGYSGLDIEPEVSSVGRTLTDIVFRNNILGTWTNSFVSGDGVAGTNVSNVVISGNLVTGSSLLTDITLARRSSITFANNTSLVSDSGPVLRFAHIDGLTVYGNVQPLSSGTLMSTTDCTGVALTGGGTSVLTAEAHQGMGYMEVWVNAPKTISGSSNKARETFTPSYSSSVASVSVRLHRTSGSDPLVFTVETAAGVAIASGSVPAGSISTTTDKWVTATLPTTVLAARTPYHLVLSTAAGTTYSIYAIERGDNYSFDPVTYFSDGHGEYTTDGGATWRGFDQPGGSTNNLNADLQFYFGAVTGYADVTVPSSIDATGGTDVASALTSFIAAQSPRTTIHFNPAGTYLLSSHGIMLDGLTGITLEGAGATLKTTGYNPINTAILLGWGAGGNSNIAIHGFAMMGGNPDGATTSAYHVGQEGSSGVGVYRDEDQIEISGNTIHDQWGHGVYLASGGHAGERPTNVSIHDNTILRTGVMGIALATCTDVSIYGNAITDVAIYPIDFEDGTSGELMERILVQRNTINRWSWCPSYSPHAIAADGSTGMTWDTITIDSNIILGGSQGVASGSADGIISFWGSDTKNNVVVTNNVSSVTVPGWATRFNNVAGLTIQHNTQPVASGGVLDHLVSCTSVVDTPNP